MRFSLRQFLLLALLLPLLSRAQAPPNMAPDALSQLQVQQPSVDVSSPVTASANFDPPIVRVGEKTFYRVVINAAEASIQWPKTVPAPPELKFSPATSGQLVQYLGNKFRPFTTFLCEVRPTGTGQFTVPNFVMEVDGKPVQIPGANVDVDNSASGPPARQLAIEASDTNIFLGEPFHVRVLLFASPANEIEALNGVQFNGNGFMADQSTAQQTIKMVAHDDRVVPAYVFEETLTPIMTGALKLFAQAFTAGREFSGPITITGPVVIPGGPPHYVLLVSDPIEVHVRPLPVAGRLTGFTGAIGQFICGPPQLSANRIAVGQPVRLTVDIRSEGDLNRLVPPQPPQVNDWQIIPDESGFAFTLIPLTDETRETPAIPFCYFDPEKAAYVDLTIPSLPVTVSGEGLPTALPATDTGYTSSPQLQLSELSPTPGKSATSLKPLQLRGWMIGLQLVPVIGFLGLWRWDCRRRFFEAHPEIVRRRQARRSLRREKRRLQQAVGRGDTVAFVHHAANVLKIACAPHYATHPQALVCAEVLERLDAAERNGLPGETVRGIFAAADARFASVPQRPTDWSALQSGLNAVLLKLEEQL